MSILSSIWRSHHRCAAPGAPAPAIAARRGSADSWLRPSLPRGGRRGRADRWPMCERGGGNWRTSIVDLLKLLDLDPASSARKELAPSWASTPGRRQRRTEHRPVKAVWRSWRQWRPGPPALRSRAMPSSVIRRFSYDEPQRRLRVTFTSGDVYDYVGVPPTRWRDFRAASSKGRFFAAHIRDRYPFERIASRRPERGPEHRRGRCVRVEMLDHTGIVVTDLKAARRFYDAVAGALGLRNKVDHQPELLPAGQEPGESHPLSVDRDADPRPTGIEGSRPGSTRCTSPSQADEQGHGAGASTRPR